MKQPSRKSRPKTDMGLKAVQAGRPDLAGQHFNNALNAEDLKDDRTRRDELAVLSMLFDEVS
jgi:hypothetical protein